MAEPHVHILMGTKNGGMFLADQLASIRGQSHQDWSLWASDDGSTDGTWEALENFKAETPHHDIHLLKGPQRGVAANYYKLLKNHELDGKWVAFSDQDDVWLPHKLSRAVALVGRLGGRCVYSSRSYYVDQTGGRLGTSPMLNRPYRFGNAIVQNVLRGNTIVIPPIVTNYLRSILSTTDVAETPFHDWWMYQAITGAGFGILHDQKPGVLYRQHGENLVGAPVRHLRRRARCMADGTLVNWIDANAAAMYRIAPVLTAAAREQLLRFLDWRSQSHTKGRAALTSLGIYRQTQAGDLALRALAQLKRF